MIYINEEAVFLTNIFKNDGLEGHFLNRKHFQLSGT